MIAACQTAAALLVVTQVGLLAALVDAVFVGQSSGRQLMPDLLLLAVVGVLRSVVSAGQEFLAARASVRVRAELRRASLAAIVTLGPGWVQRQPAGRLATATGPGLDALDGYVSRALPAIVAAVVVPVVVLVRIGWADWQAGLLLLVMLPLVPLFMALVGVTTKRRVQRQYLMLSRLSGHFLDLLRGLTTLTVYGQAARQERALREATDRYRRHALGALRIAFLSALVLDLVAALSIAVIAVDIGLRLDASHVSLTTALVVLFLAPELFAPLRALGVNYHASEEGTTAAAAALDVIEAAANCPAPRPGERVIADGSLALTNLSVGFAGRTDAALSQVDLLIRPGELVALVGASGAGKSTVLATLLGFAVPSAGSVCVGVGGASDDLATLDADTWRTNLAWLPQRPMPSQTSVGAEVRLGAPAASEAALARACRECRTPPPDTPVSADGRSVSAGERRRIALARTLLRARSVAERGGTPIVLLDEPSEDLDRHTELVVAEVISSMAGWATVVVATHSPLLTSLAGRRVTLEGGRLVADERRTPVLAPVAGPARSSRPIAVPGRDEAREGPPLRLRELARSPGVARRIGWAALLAGAAGLAGLGLTASSTWLIVRAAEHPNVQALGVAVVAVRMFAIGRAVLRYGERLSAHDAALRALAGLRVRVLAAVRPLDPAALGRYGRGDLLRRFVGDVDGVQDGLVRVLVPVLGAGLTGVGAVVLASVLAPAAGLVLAVALVFGGALVPWMTARSVGDCAPLVELAGRRDARSGALVEALPELLAYGAAGRAVEQIAGLDADVSRRSMRPARAASLGVLLSGSAAALALPAAVAAGAAAVRGERLSPVDIGVLAVCVLAAFDAVAPLPAAFAAWTRCRSALARVGAVLAAEALLPDPVEVHDVPPAPVGLYAAAAGIAPARSAPLVLQDVWLHIEPGARVAVTGPSGSGKSTLLATAMRLLPVRGGALVVRGHDGADVALELLAAGDVPPLIAGSLQGDHVFDVSLRDNLRVVRPAASDTDLDEVARRAGLLGFVDSLPQRWSTPAGPDGAAVSGGERQRLLLARALLADPQILVLDEPTAHLDAATERQVLADLLDATAGRTVLMSTHRRLAPEAVTQVLGIDGGRLVAAPGAATQTRSDHASSLVGRV